MSHDVALPGLDGGNPLAFLAALGTHRTAARTWTEQNITMSWAAHNGSWSPCLHSVPVADQDSFLHRLAGSLESDPHKHPIAFMHSVHGASQEALRSLFRDQAEGAAPRRREVLDYLGALVSDYAADPAAASQLQTARRDYFWGNLEKIISGTQPQHLCRTLFETWDYADPMSNQSLHLEPSEDRRHGYQWHEPTGDPSRGQCGGMLGANRLAIEAFPLFRSVAAGDRLSTLGFSGCGTADIRWTWPLWSCRFSPEVVATVLGIAELQQDEPDCRVLRAMGICTAYRCRRILVGKTPNFTPAMPL